MDTKEKIVILLKMAIVNINTNLVKMGNPVNGLKIENVARFIHKVKSYVIMRSKIKYVQMKNLQ